MKLHMGTAHHMQMSCDINVFVSKVLSHLSMQSFIIKVTSILRGGLFLFYPDLTMNILFGQQFALSVAKIVTQTGFAVFTI